MDMDIVGFQWVIIEEIIRLRSLLNSKILRYSPSLLKSSYQMIQMLEIWQTFVDKFYNFLDELLNWRFNPRQNIGQIKLSAGDFQFKDERNNFTQMRLKKNANIIFHNSNNRYYLS